MNAPKFTQERLLGLVRHFIGAVGGALVVFGVADEATAEALAGAAMTIAAFALSFFAPEKDPGKVGG